MSLGKNGDLYINRDTGDYYAKVDGVWIRQGNIRDFAQKVPDDGVVIDLARERAAPPN